MQYYETTFLKYSRSFIRTFMIRYLFISVSKQPLIEGKAEFIGEIFREEFVTRR